MSNSKLEYDLKSAILSTGLLQPVSATSTSKSISVMCRAVPGQDKVWMKTMEGLLESAVGDFHICKRFVFKEGKMVFGWHLGIDSKSAKNLKTAINWLCEYLGTVKPTLNPEPVPQSNPYNEPPAPALTVSQPVVLPKGMPPPRPPGEPAAVQPAPPSFVFKATQISQEEEIIPLPHVYSEMNVPNEKGRGATYLRKDRNGRG